ncbi:hypothetical protein K0M31_008265, partial [Melipona bicolor]
MSVFSLVFDVVAVAQGLRDCDRDCCAAATVMCFESSAAKEMLETAVPAVEDLAATATTKFRARGVLHRNSATKFSGGNLHGVQQQQQQQQQQHTQ